MIKSYIKNLLPQSVLLKCRTFRSHIIRHQRESYQCQLVNVLRQKAEPFNVLFLAYDAAIWKYDSLYNAMRADVRFNPKVLVCPHVRFGKEAMIERMERCYADLYNRDYNVIKGYDHNKDQYVLPAILEPDIIFYSNPSSYDVDKRYCLESNQSVLSCYANYFYIGVDSQWSCASDFHLSVWRYYVENELLIKQIRKHAGYNSHNAKVVGYPLFDSFRLKEENLTSKKSHRKTIIWAPHHTIDGFESFNGLRFSTFLSYASYMMEVAKRYEDIIEIVFKPHPLLKEKLYMHGAWGREKTDAYYDMWQNGKNTSLAEGDYIDLFLSSDGMMHDCDSFTVEYLYTRKPVMYLDSYNRRANANEIAQKALDCHYIGKAEEDIEKFIKMIIEGGEDELKEKREAFYKNYILPPNGKLAAENIIDDLLTSLGRK